MKIIETKVYEFDELPADIQQKVLEDECYCNVEHFDWWESTYEDAKRIGLTITGFDLDRGSYCKGELELDSAAECAETILKEHGKTCETYKTAQTFLKALEELTSTKENIEDVPEEDIENLENEFIHDLLEDYRIILQHEYEYLTSKEAIIETIKANEGTFTAEGKMMNA